MRTNSASAPTNSNTCAHVGGEVVGFFLLFGGTGAGGSSGFSYLKATAERHKVFNDLFNLSTYMIGLEYLPKLPLALRKALAFKLREEGQQEE